MKPLICLLLALSVSVAVSRAEEREWTLLEIDGASYSNAKLMKKEPDGIRIVYDGGITSIAYEKLPAHLQKELKFDEAKAIAYRAEKEQEKLDAISAEKERKLAKRERAKEMAELRKLNFDTVAVQVDRVLSDGALICYPIQEVPASNGSSSGNTAQRAMLTFANSSPTPGTTMPAPGLTVLNKPVYVTGIEGEWAEGDVIRTSAARAGVKEHDGRTLAWWVGRPR